MINFRYHVVSLTAVFLALAIGLVVGTAALNGPVADSLKEQVNGAAQGQQPAPRPDRSAAWTRRTARGSSPPRRPRSCCRGKLTGRRVRWCSLPTGRDHVEGVAEMLTTAGAKITGTVALQDKFINPDNNAELLELADKAPPPSVQPTAGAAGQRARRGDVQRAAGGGAAGPHPGGAAPADLQCGADASTSNAGYLSVEGKLTGPAEAVVVVAAAVRGQRGVSEERRSVVTTVEQFDHAGSIVVAGATAADGNLVAEVRGDPVLAKTISTVDNATPRRASWSTALGRVASSSRGSKAGQYGVGDERECPPAPGCRS